MSEHPPTRSDRNETAAGGLYRLALRLGPLLEPQESTAGVAAACAELLEAEWGLLLADGLPPGAAGMAPPSPEEAQAIRATPIVQAASQLLGVSVMPPRAVPLPGEALLAAALPGPEGGQGVLLLARTRPLFCVAERALLAEALPLVGQTLERAWRHNGLRRAELARGGAVGRLAHDIRSPLVSAHAAIEIAQRLLRDQPVAGTIFDTLTTGLRSVQAAVELCDDLLEVSRLTHGVAISVRRVELGRLCAECCELLVPLAMQRDVLLKALPSAGELWVAGDERLLRRMLSNLLVNGLRFAPPGGAVVAEARRETADEALLLVADNGPGVAEADRERIFLPFAQGPGEAGRGVGLGLALCREVALAHGGAIRVEERPGGGTRFVVRLPMLRP